MYSRPPLPPAGVPRRLPGSSSRLTPQRAAEIAERGARLPAGQGDRFSGYAVLGVPFASGDVLALRRYTASTLGPGYTSVWHRSPAGRWVFYSDVAPDQSCARYFGGAVDRTVVGAIRLDWPSPCRLQVVVPSRLDWVIDLALSPAAWLFNAATDAMPEPWWQSRRVLRALGLFARVALGTGPVTLTGRTPNGHRFTAAPRRLWVVTSSLARVGNRDVGAAGPLTQQAALGDMRIPQRGLFVIDQSRLETPAARVAGPRLNGTAEDCVLASLRPPTSSSASDGPRW